MNIHNINTIARYEVKLLKRSWLFRIFAGLALIVITFILLGRYSAVLNSFGNVWKETALTSQLPFVATYFYNIAQSVIVIFLAGSFLKRDKKLDTAEVTYVRPMSNADYIVGKTWGIIRVFLSLNVVILSITAFVNIVINHSPFNVLPYLFYLLTISFPSLLFVLGLSFTAMCLLKNQAITFLVMLGIVGMVFFYVEDSLNGVFDFFGVYIPAIFSDVIGHANLSIFLLQRLTYLLLGVGFICFTISLVKRLPHRPWKVVVTNTLGSVFIAFGCIAGLVYILHFRSDSALRHEYAESYDKFVKQENIRILTHHITVAFKDKKIEAESKFTVKNNTSENIPQIILFLNPGLKVDAIECNGASIPFKRENQVIIVDKATASGEECSLSLKYDGTIDENVCYTDIEDKLLENTKVNGTLSRFGKRYAYVEDRYVLLTPECLWYPVAIAPANPKTPYNIKKNFTRYTLKVAGQGSKTILSQGNKQESEGNITFTNPTPLTGISLTIADYERKALRVDSTDYEIYYFKGHDFFSKHFEDIQDTVPAIIREQKNSLEIQKGRDYLFNKFIIAETPVHFAAYIRNWKGYTEYVMPEVVFIPEKGVSIEVDFPVAIKRSQNWGSGRGGQVPDIFDIKMMIFRTFILNTFINEQETRQGMSTLSQELNKFNIKAMFFNYLNFIHSDAYPIIDISLSTMQNSASIVIGGRGWWGGAINDRQRANLYLENHSFKAATQDENIKPEIFHELLKLKSDVLRDFIIIQVPKRDFDPFMKKFTEQYRFMEVDFSEFTRQLSEQFNVDISAFLEKWYTEDQTPTILIKNVEANQVLVDDYTKYQVRLDVYNPSDVDALISARTTSGGRGGRGGAFVMVYSFSEDNNRSYIIPAKEARQIRIISDDRPANVSVETNISHNIPTSQTFSFSKVDNVINDTMQGIFPLDLSAFARNSEEIIVDNESNGFKLIESNSRHKLKDIFKKEDEEKYKNFMLWNPPSKWTLFASEICYGESVLSGLYKIKGNGANAVEWSAQIPASGYYEIAVWNPKLSFGGRRNNDEERTQSYTIEYGSEKETISINLEKEERGWVSLGNFYLPQETVKITLTDKVTGNYVVADAVRFKAVKE